jgi:hypothetical protein
MTTPKQRLSRRPVIAGLGVVTAAAAAGIAFDQFTPRHKRATGPDANLINHLDDPATGAVLGRAILAEVSNRKTATDAARTFAQSRLASASLPTAVSVDVAQNFLAEANGWVIPITLGALCVLATESEY